MPRVLFVTGVLCWIAAVAAGFVVIERYTVVPGKESAGGDWPAGVTLALDARRPTLLMFAHPLCPCTRSSLEELNRTIAQAPGTAAVTIVFTVPKDADDDWTQSTLYQIASHSKGVSTLVDIEGAEAARFGVHTSGNVLVYDVDGRLMFDGGVTAARGHEGDNDGRTQLQQVLAKGTDKLLKFPVFGCGLVGAGDSPEGTTHDST